MADSPFGIPRVPGLLGLLTGQGAGAQTSGLLGGAPAGGVTGLLNLYGNSLRFQPDPNEGLSDKIFGNPTNPLDPRPDMMAALSVGLLRGDFASGLENAFKARQGTEDRALKRTADLMTLTRGGLELQAVDDAMRRNAAIQGDLAKMRQGGQRAAAQYPAAAQTSGQDSFGIPSIGGVPMFGLGSQQMPTMQPNARSVPASAGGFPGQSLSYPASSDTTSRTRELYDSLLNEADVYRRYGDNKTSMELLQRAEQFKPKFSTTPHVVKDPRTGNLVQVMLNEDGQWQVLPFGVKSDIELRDMGGTVQAIDKNETANGQQWGKTMSPSDRIAAGNLEVSRQRLALDESAPQYIQTDAGLVAVPKRPGAGSIAGQVVTGPSGEPLSKPLASIPANVNAAIVTNAQNLQKATTALALVQGQSVGGMQGDAAATGWKGYAPNSMLNRFDPSGVDARAAIADLGSMIIHDRSGTAVTAAEFPRLAPFIPQPTDDAGTVKKKLQRFVEVYQQEAQALNETYSKDNGYKPNPIVGRSAQGAQATQSQAPVVPPNATTRDLRVGQAYTLPNGKQATWDGFQFKVVK